MKRTHKPLHWRAGIAVAALVAVSMFAAQAPADASGATRVAKRTSDILAAATGQVSAHDGSFWVGSNKVVLHGANVKYPCCSSTNFTLVASWHMNFVRLVFQWSLLEPTAPVHLTDGTWAHTYDSSYLTKFAADVARAQQAGLYVLLDNAGYAGSYFNYPDWLYQAAYNSHGITYPQTPDGAAQAATDFWSDPLRQQFMVGELQAAAGALKAQVGLMGYEILNEPQPGLLDNSATTTQTMLDWQLQAAKAIRAIDPARVVVFTTRFGYAPGVAQADLSGFVSLGNVAFDAHDYFGARWGSGLVSNPSNSLFDQAMQATYENVLGSNGTSSPGNPYIGTVAEQVRWIQQFVDPLSPQGIPLLIGEFGINGALTPSAFLYFGTVTAAMNNVGVSWAVSQYNSNIGIMDSAGNLFPWANIVINAA